MTLKEAYKQWSQQKENYQLFIKTRKIFGEVWSNTPFHLECSEYHDTDLAQYLLSSKRPYEDKVKATSVMIHVLQFGLCGISPGFSMKSVLEIYNNYLQESKQENQSKPKSQEQKPQIKYNNKPLIPQEIPEEPKVIEKKSKNCKPVYQFNDLGSLIKKWNNVKEVAKALDVKETSIYKAISAGFKVKDSFWSRNSELIDIDVVGDKPVKSKPKKVTSNTADLIPQLKDIVNKLRKSGIDIKVIINI